jgi:hypothetical protein
MVTFFSIGIESLTVLVTMPYFKNINSKDIKYFAIKYIIIVYKKNLFKNI